MSYTRVGISPWKPPKPFFRHRHRLIITPAAHARACVTYTCNDVYITPARALAYNQLFFCANVLSIIDQSMSLAEYKNDAAGEERSQRGELLLAMERTTSSGKLFIGTLTLFAAVGGFLFGYDTGIISGSLLKLRVEFNLSVAWQEAVVSVTVGAAAVSSIIAGPSCDMLGRRPVLLAASVVFTIGAVIMGAAQNAVMLLMGRITVGVGVGFAAMAVPMYIAEVAPASARGKLILFNSMFITGGMFSATIMAGALSSLPLHIGWR